MGRPSTPRGWIIWALRAREIHYSPRRALVERTGRCDRRLDYSYETAISVLALLERSSNGTGSGGVQLVLDVATGVLPWVALTAKEQDSVVKISRRFRRFLQEEGFLPEH